MKNPEPASSSSYSERFQRSADVESYEGQEYAATSYSSRIWQLQQPYLRQILLQAKQERKAPVRLMDFACGTGRILSFIEDIPDVSEGVDISASMAELARKKCRTATVRVGNILTEPNLLQAPYHIITSFRFLLNVEKQLRSSALKRLREVIDPNGILVVNVHGNSRSLRHPAIAWKRRQISRNPQATPPGLMLNEMSPAETRALLAESGFEVVRVLGFGVLPPSLYRTALGALAFGFDRLLAGRFLAEWSVDMLYVCRPKRDA